MGEHKIGWEEKGNKKKKNNMKNGRENEEYVKKNRQRKIWNVDMKKSWHCKRGTKRKKEDAEKNIKEKQTKAT